MSVSPTVPASRVLGFQNRFDALREPERIVDEERGRVQGEAGEPLAMEFRITMRYGGLTSVLTPQASS